MGVIFACLGYHTRMQSWQVILLTLIGLNALAPSKSLKAWEWPYHIVKGGRVNCNKCWRVWNCHKDKPAQETMGMGQKIEQKKSQRPLFKILSVTEVINFSQLLKRNQVVPNIFWTSFLQFQVIQITFCFGILIFLWIRRPWKIHDPTKTPSGIIVKAGERKNKETSTAFVKIASNKSCCGNNFNHPVTGGTWDVWGLSR
jgi:hypothetical protein